MILVRRHLCLDGFGFVSEDIYPGVIIFPVEKDLFQIRNISSSVASGAPADFRSCLSADLPQERSFAK